MGMACNKLQQSKFISILDCTFLLPMEGFFLMKEDGLARRENH